MLVIGRLALDNMNAYSQNMREWWNNADETFSHVKYNRWLGSSDKLVSYWNATWLHKLPRSPGHVVEYGIGAGLLGKTLLSHNAMHYTGLDISDRSLLHAERMLSQCCASRYDLQRVDKSLVPRQLEGANTFVSQAVIQHFPSLAYFESFCNVLNGSFIWWLMLQVRESKRRPTSVTYSLSVSHSDIARLLPSFRIAWRSRRYSNGYVFYVLERVNGAAPPRQDHDLFASSRKRAFL